MTTPELPPEIEKQLELYERIALDQGGPQVLAAFSAMARCWLYNTFSPHEYEHKYLDGFHCLYQKKTITKQSLASPDHRSSDALKNPSRKQKGS